MDKCRELPTLATPPIHGWNLGATSGNLEPVLDKLLEMDQVLAGALTYAFQPCMVYSGHPKSHLCLLWWSIAWLVVASIPSRDGPKPGPQFT